MRILPSSLLFFLLVTPLQSQPAPESDPALARYYINLKSSPRSKQAEPVATELPFSLEEGDRIALIGNGLFDNARHYGFLESLLHQRFPEHKLEIRNFAWPADEVDLQPRPDNFGDLDQHLTYYETDVILAAYGFNESFAGAAGLPAFRARFDAFPHAIEITGLQRTHRGTNRCSFPPSQRKRQSCVSRRAEQRQH